MTIFLRGKGLTLAQVEEFLKDDVDVRVHAAVNKRLARVRSFVEKKLGSQKPFYGINTGFGLLAGKRVSDNELDELQENLVMSHAVGVGEPFETSIVRLIMLLRANVLAMGHSGIRPETLELLVQFINRGISPIIPRKGSVSASGDLAQLAHVALAMIGKGEVEFEGSRMLASTALSRAGLRAVQLKAKEGIALINGTQATAAVASMVMLKAEQLIKVADIVGTIAIEGDKASRRPFDPRVHRVRPHPGQISTARNVRRLISGSQIIASHSKCTRVQDPYSFRCIPQVHGAVKDVYRAARRTIEIELGSCTDNPLLFDRHDEILSGGNFHAEPLGLFMDSLSVAIAELGNISERRMAILTAPLQRELSTKFLVKNAGLNSGLMIPHVAMAALASENKCLAHPACVDSIPTSGGQEDHVSMGLIAARKAYDIAENVAKILAIELMAACQAIDLSGDGKRPGKGTEAVYKLVREKVPYIDRDREFQYDIAQCISLVEDGSIIRAAESIIGPLSI